MPTPTPTHPSPPPKPSTPPQAHKPEPQPHPEPAKKADEPMKAPVAGVAPPEPGLTLGARPKDARDPQSAKFEAHAAPPSWNAPKDPPPAREEWVPDPSLDAREQQPPKGYYADGMSAPDEQRARAAWVEAHGVKAYDEATDQRPAEDKPTFDPHALAGGGAFVSAGKQRQVPGVVPPTKRE